MKGKLEGSAVAGMLLGVSLVTADVIVDDFTLWVQYNKLGGIWLADSDFYSKGTSTVVDILENKDVVVASERVLATYDDLNKNITSKVKVAADVSADKKWAYAGWVMDFLKIDTAGTGKQTWELDQWDRKNEVDISSCDALEMNFEFTKGRQLWVEVYAPGVEKKADPQYGWRISDSTTGIMANKRLNLKGLGRPTLKYGAAGPVWPLEYVLTKVNRIKILYEGHKGIDVAVPTPYDAESHTLKVGAIKLLGADCKVVPNPGSSNGVLPRSKAVPGMNMQQVGGQLHFINLPGDFQVTLRDLRGQVMAAGAVSATHPSLDASGLQAGIYTVQARSGKINRSFTITLLK